jgi:hypothetical protein
MTARQHYPVHLITDSKGKEILIDALELPYQRVSTALDELSELHSDYWAFGKLYAYQCQTEPFLSVDADVYLWDRLLPYIENADLICQEHEYFDGVRGLVWLYPEAMRHTRGFALPDWVGKVEYACNAGVFGGKNVAFFAELWEAAESFLQQNHLKMQDPFPRELMNIFCEQYFAACLAAAKDLKFMTIRSDYENWGQVFARFRYTHLIHQGKKQFGQQVETKVKQTYPEYYARILQYEKEISVTH